MEKKKLIIFMDSGDTLIDEGTEVRTEAGGVVYRASFIPGAKQTLLELKKRGYPVILVADGLKESFDRIYAGHHLEDVFDARIVSETIGENKPSAKMFGAAMEAMNLTEADKGRILMVGNNIRRDITGANRFGIHSVLLTWSDRYDYKPQAPEQVPEFEISRPEQLLDVIEKLENQI